MRGSFLDDLLLNAIQDPNWLQCAHGYEDHSWIMLLLGNETGSREVARRLEAGTTGTREIRCKLTKSGRDVEIEESVMILRYAAPDRALHVCTQCRSATAWLIVQPRPQPSTALLHHH